MESRNDGIKVVSIGRALNIFKAIGDLVNFFCLCWNGWHREFGGGTCKRRLT